VLPPLEVYYVVLIHRLAQVSGVVFVDDSTKLDRVTMFEAPLNHPTDAELRALSGGPLRDVELARVWAHLEICPECCRRIDELGSDDPLLGRLRQSAARTKEVLVPPELRRSAVHALREGQGARPKETSGPHCRQKET
jgi:hypothetical protein